MIPLGKKYCQAVRHTTPSSRQKRPCRAIRKIQLLHPSGISSCSSSMASWSCLPSHSSTAHHHSSFPWLIINISAPAAHMLPSPELALKEKARAPCQPIWGSVMSSYSSRSQGNSSTMTEMGLRSDPHIFIFKRKMLTYPLCSSPSLQIVKAAVTASFLAVL